MEKYLNWIIEERDIAKGFLGEQVIQKLHCMLKFIPT